MVDYRYLDPGIRDIVRRLNEAGFETTDSGDGVSKPREMFEAGCAIPFPHVVAVSRPETMIADAERAAAVLGEGWTVEASYSTHDKSTHLFARTLDARER
jgi:hypothetical protein